MTQAAAAVRDALESGGIAPGSVLAIGLCDQRETVAAWDRRTGKSLTNAVVWQCGRAQALCRAIAEPDAAYVRQTTGLPLSPYFSAAKMAWLLRRCPAVQEAAQRGTLCLGTVDAWLLFCLTEGRTFATDVSNASRTQLIGAAPYPLGPAAAGAVRHPAGGAAGESGAAATCSAPLRWAGCSPRAYPSVP